MDDVEFELRYMGVKIWRTRVLERTEWASVLREIEAVLIGCSAKEEESHNFILFARV